ncbi:MULTISPECIES: hypothetical protein [Bacillus]|uniref:hypothetical protein n=1 Tax=Bacillus TaxID=1386 RepID=UPI0006A83BE3|nr:MULTISPECIES: hypothetical protein [Bacillus]ARW38092.1 hypothetical protein S101267_01002 [Bacillus amyloliquefaciens]AZI46191.1 hypothetical protein BVMH_04635 [Bacillus velezensis]KYC92538.1 hypothetical protein B425_0866 [Bacillus amyloliquefaciens]MBM7029121.1 hypothetical protein [Bacillus velezensis]MBY0032094.1 hypothetical protein [Bacillus velezensis]
MKNGGNYKASLLQIEIDHIDAVPRVFYKGEQIEGIVHAHFSFLTNTETIIPTHIDIKYVDKENAPETKAIIYNRDVLKE